jgi:hypothetical protein
MMKNHPVKDRLLRMSRTIDSRHSGRMASRNGPTHGDDRVSLERRDEARLEQENQGKKHQQALMLSGGNGKRQLNPRRRSPRPLVEPSSRLYIPAFHMIEHHVYQSTRIKRKDRSLKAHYNE